MGSTPPANNDTSLEDAVIVTNKFIVNVGPQGKALIPESMYPLIDEMIESEDWFQDEPIEPEKDPILPRDRYNVIIEDLD
jgi:hypothetical protein